MNLQIRNPVWQQQQLKVEISTKNPKTQLKLKNGRETHSLEATIILDRSLKYVMALGSIKMLNSDLLGRFEKMSTNQVHSSYVT